VFGLNIAVLICLDLADFSAVASVVKNSDRVDVLLVPCYSEYTDSLKRVAKAASAALRGVVALVNYRESPEPPCIVEEFGKPSPSLVKAPRELESGGIIHTVVIQPQALRQRKLEIKGSSEERWEWLFGAQNLEPR
jgi:predicted amidohydrolase